MSLSDRITYEQFCLSREEEEEQDDLELDRFIESEVLVGVFIDRVCGETFEYKSIAFALGKFDFEIKLPWTIKIL